MAVSDFPDGVTFQKTWFLHRTEVQTINIAKEKLSLCLITINEVMLQSVAQFHAPESLAFKVAFLILEN